MKNLICALLVASVPLIAAADNRESGARSNPDYRAAPATPAASEPVDRQLRRPAPAPPVSRQPDTGAAKARQVDGAAAAPGVNAEALKGAVYAKRTVTVQVQQAGGEHEQWGSDIVITAPSTLDFQWTADGPPVSRIRWVVSKKKPALHNDTESAIASGYANEQNFPVAFNKFIPEYPPAAPNKYTYWLTAYAVDAAGLAVGDISEAPVKVTYKAPDQFIMDECTSNKDCPAGKSCLLDKTCGVPSYFCEKDHLIKGTDGSTSDCSPYRCMGNSCRTKCASIVDCVDPYVCKANRTCGPRGT